MFQKLGYRDFWEIAKSVFKKGKSAISLQFNFPEVSSSVFCEIVCLFLIVFQCRF